MEESYDEQSLWRDRNKIFVAGLPQDVDDAVLSSKFEQFGAMFQAKVVYDNKTQKSRGFGFVTFQTYESALDAVRAMDQSKWDKRVLNVRFLTPKTGGNTPAPSITPIYRAIEPRPEGCTTVFVGNMPYEITEEVLRKVMSVCGEIKAIRFAEDIKTKEFRGFGYVQFFEGEACEKAVQTLHGAVVMGRPLKVDYGARDAPQVSEAKEALQKKLKKGICHKFQQGLCDRGDSCKFAHVEEHTPFVVDTTGATGQPNATKSLNNVPDDAPVCMAFQNGKCNRGSQCKYRHIGKGAETVPETVVEEEDDDDDTPICLAFQKGKCKRGDQCKYRHKSPAAVVTRQVPVPARVTIPVPVRPVAVQIPTIRHTVKPAPVAAPEDDTPICMSFQKGKCKRGNACKFRHVGGEVATRSEAPVTSVPEPTTRNWISSNQESSICKSFSLKGKCKRGEMCNFIHDETKFSAGISAPSAPSVQEAPEVDDDDTPVCQSFQKGTCKRGDKCKFRHVMPKEVCQRYLQGKCTKANTCNFDHPKRAHDDDDDDDEPKKKKKRKHEE